MPKKKKKRKSRRKIKRKSSKKRKSRKISKSKKKRNRKKNSKTGSKDSAEKIYRTKSDWVKNALINKSMYEKKYKESVRNNNDFWAKEGKRITWIKPYT